MARVLIVDDDPKIRLFFSKLLSQMGHDSQAAETVARARELAENTAFDLILLDLELPDGNGLDILPDLTRTFSEPEVIIITGTGDARGAELAFKYGAWDYVQKPFLLEEVSLPITRALQYRQEKQAVRRPVSLKRSRIVGESKVIQACLEDVARAAVTDASVLITGETGTGKELFARAVHENSKRAGAPFVAVDCGALPDTLVESTLFGHEKGAFTGAGKKQDGLILQAHGGTLMLDEVGNLPIDAQKSLLRSLQERRVRPVGGSREIPVNIRLVAATYLNLEEMVRDGRFREDLLFRIRAMEIRLPPLRDRGEDIEAITVNKCHELAVRYDMDTKAISPEFIQTLSALPWPGNVRELMNVLEYALASSGQDPTLFPKHLPAAYRMARLAFDPPVGDPETARLPEGELPSLGAFRDSNEKSYLKQLIRQVNGDRTAACRIAGISQSRLYGLLKKHGLPKFGNS